MGKGLRRRLRPRGPGAAPAEVAAKPLGCHHRPEVMAWDLGWCLVRGMLKGVLSPLMMRNKAQEGCGLLCPSPGAPTPPTSIHTALLAWQCCACPLLRDFPWDVPSLAGILVEVVSAPCGASHRVPGEGHKGEGPTAFVLLSQVAFKDTALQWLTGISPPVPQFPCE